MAEGILRSSQVQALLRLVNEAHALQEETAARSRHLLTGLCRILGAEEGGCVLERAFGPEGRGDYTIVMPEGRRGGSLRALEVLQKMGNACNPAIRSMMARAPEPGAVVTARRCDLVADRSWYGTPYVERYLRAAGLDDAVYSMRWSRRPHEVRGIGIYRGWRGRPFDAADRELLHLFHTECGPLLEPPSSGTATEAPPGVQLSRRERQTLELVLDGLGDKQIAERLGISRFTVNHYTKSIYRRFEVNSRAELIVRFLGADARGATSGLEVALSSQLPSTSGAPGRSRATRPLGDDPPRPGFD